MPPEVCPLLGTLDDTNNPCQPVEYPSFENHCLVSDDRDTLLLADQATYCLSGGHAVCPRFQIASAARRGARVDPRVAAELTGGALASDQLRPELMASALEGEERANNRRWAWVGTGMVFIAMMLCGSVFAVWSGWQQVQGFLAQQEVGAIAAITSPGSDQPAFVVITATPDPLVIAAAPPPAAANAPGGEGGNAAGFAATAGQQGDIVTGAQVTAPDTAQGAAQQFPAAVTATPASGFPEIPVAALPSTGGTQPGELLQIPAQEPPNVLLEVPTRRPTPIFDIPTSTAAADAPPLAPPTFTPTPTIAGTPSVVFGPAQQLVKDGDCTMISWQVENVREVYYENIGVDGRGQWEECVDDTLEVYHLVVVLPDGSSRTYTTTVTMLRPTHTPQPTPTFTPYVEPTPSWTPVPPTPTPTTVVNYGVTVNVRGNSSVFCTRGTTCTVDLVVLNTGPVPDTMLASVMESGAWSAQLCRSDGVCANAGLALVDMGAGNSANIHLSVSVPADASGTQRYSVNAYSNGSGGSARSGDVYIEFTTQ